MVYKQPIGVLRHIARQLALMGIVASEREFSNTWLGMEGWTRSGVPFIPDGAFHYLCDALKQKEQELALLIGRSSDDTLWSLKIQHREIQNLRGQLIDETAYYWAVSCGCFWDISLCDYSFSRSAS